ncbi:YCF48-related protein, partial [Oleiphilus sp. HI0066]|uniref:WD40/YVTN/BNR-like repeat-containing protein n=4 Tax=Oleiphilus TaxID=141450 RepID=UPI0007C36288
GSSWQQADVPVSVLLTAVDFVSSDKGWAVGHGGVILHSNDGGLSWVKQFDGNQANQSIIEQAEAYIAELEFELDESGGSDEDLEYELEDAQYALEDAELDAEIGASKPFLDVAFLTDTHGFAVGAYGFLFETTDGGRTWENAGDRLDNLDRFHLNAIKVLEGGNLIIAGEAGVLFTSSDKGQSWDTVNSPYEGSFFGVLPLKDKNSALVFGLRGNLFKTVNAGRSWSKVDSGTESSLMGGALDGNKQISITGNAGTVIVSNDGGETFSSYSRADRL